MSGKQETSADIIAEMRDLAEHRDWNNHARQSNRERISDIADRLEAALKREVDKLNSAIQATVGRSDAEIDRLRREIAEMRQAGDAAKLPDGWKMYDKYQIRHTDGTPLKGKRYFVLRLDSDDPLEAARVAAAMSAYKGETPQGNVAKLSEAMKRVVAASIVAKNANAPEWILQRMADIFAVATTSLAAPPRNCDVGSAVEQKKRFVEYCKGHRIKIAGHADVCNPKCPCRKDGDLNLCVLAWAQLPYEAKEGGNNVV